MKTMDTVDVKTGEPLTYVAWKAINDDDPYGRAIFRFAEEWADEMEAKFDAGASMEDAYATWKDVDQRPGFGITGFMFCAARSVLKHCWAHRDAFKVVADKDPA